MHIGRNAAIVVLGATAVVAALVLFQGPLRDYIPQDFGFVTKLPFIIGVLVVLVGVGSIALAYGFGLDDSLGQRHPGRRQLK